MSGSWSHGKGDRYRSVDRKKWDDGWSKAFGEKTMSRPRYSPRFSGLGKQIIEQAVEKNLVKMILTPYLRARIREESHCTDAEIDAAIQAGTTEFGDEFKKLLAEQRAMLTPPKENDNDTNTTG